MTWGELATQASEAMDVLAKGKDGEKE